jgi:hypothetical protein
MRLCFGCCLGSRTTQEEAEEEEEVIQLHHRAE